MDQSTKYIIYSIFYKIKKWPNPHYNINKLKIMMVLYMAEKTLINLYLHDYFGFS
jgi:hypothetical protein